jgi:Fe-S oxidoreductase
LGEVACTFPTAANAALKFTVFRKLLEKAIGLSARRSLPKYAKERFDKWFAKRPVAGLNNPSAAAHDRGYRKVILWDDTFVRYNEPHIGIAAVKVLEALGVHVSLASGRKCCGRPAFSQGNLDLAANFGEHNIKLLSSLKYSTAPVIFLEPSCYSMFAEDYLELKIPGADSIAQRSVLFEQLVGDLLDHERNGIQFQARSEAVVIHAHCHAKSILNPAFMSRLVEKLPGRTATLLETGCCGMAGAFGMMKAKRELSLQVAAPMLEKIRAQGPNVTVVASGTSCRHQISELSDVRPKHMAELLADAISAPSSGVK